MHVCGARDALRFVPLMDGCRATAIEVPRDMSIVAGRSRLPSTLPNTHTGHLQRRYVIER